MRLRPRLAIGFACACGAGCASLVGIDEWSPHGAGGGATTATTTSSDATGTGGTATTGSAGGGGTGGSGAGGAGGSAPCGPPGPGGEVALACGEQRPSAIATDGTYVYWTAEGEGAVKRVPVTGGAIEVIASGQGFACGVALTTTDVFWRTREGEVRRAPLAGGGPAPIASGEGDSCAIAVDASSVYWARTSSAFDIVRAPLGGGGPEVVISNAHVAALSAFDAQNLYWTDPWAMYLWASPKAGPATLTVVGTGNDPCGVVVDGSGAYWTDRGLSPSTGVVKRGALDGTMSQDLAFAEPDPCAVALLGADLYWVDQLALDGSVRRTSKAGGGLTEVLATAQDEPCAIATDTAFVYWTTCGGGTVMKRSSAAPVVVGSPDPP